jgi:hypothetical protein
MKQKPSAEDHLGDKATAEFDAAMTAILTATLATESSHSMCKRESWGRVI